MTNGKNGNGSSNGVHKDACIIGDHDLLWYGLSPAVTKALGQPLDPSLVSRRKGRGNRSLCRAATATTPTGRATGTATTMRPPSRSSRCSRGPSSWPRSR